MTREEFMDIVYSELYSDGDNYRANRIIDAADEYAEDNRSEKPNYTDAEIQKMQDLEFAEIQKAYEIGKAENPNKWIPVSERLPEFTINSSVFGKQFTDEVLLYDGADLRIGYFVRNDKLDFSYWVAYGEDVYEPIAWMPIEPYKASPTGAESEE